MDAKLLNKFKIDFEHEADLPVNYLRVTTFTCIIPREKLWILQNILETTSNNNFLVIFLYVLHEFSISFLLFILLIKVLNHM